jgi:DNA-binding MarR family transcriptional regulator
MSPLAASDELAFSDMRDTLEMTDGNLTSHLRTLHEAGYVAFTKSIEGARPLTTYSLTEKGRESFAEYVDVLEQIVRQTKGK